MKIAHRGVAPKIAASAWVAPTAVLSGDVTIGEEVRVMHGAVITADGGPVTIGKRCVIMENAVLRGTKRHPLSLGEGVLCGPRSYLTGCTVEDFAFLATGATVFNGATLGRGAEVRVNGVVHLRTTLAPGELVPIGWVAVGSPAKILSPERHEEIWAIQRDLDFPQEIFGVERSDDPAAMQKDMMERYTKGLDAHADDEVIE